VPVERRAPDPNHRSLVRRLKRPTSTTKATAPTAPNFSISR
jgi:hypothetical protein